MRGVPSGRKMMVLATDSSDGLAMYVGRPAILLSLPVGVPVARVPDTQQVDMVGCEEMATCGMLCYAFPIERGG